MTLKSGGHQRDGGWDGTLLVSGLCELQKIASEEEEEEEPTEL